MIASSFLFSDFISIFEKSFFVMVTKTLNICGNNVFISVDSGKLCRCHWINIDSGDGPVKNPDDASSEDLTVMSDVEKQLKEYFAGNRKKFSLPLELKGTPFQKKVWEELKKIPYGSTVSYGELSRRIGNPKAVRAVAQACGANPLAIIIPCHRVIATGGKPGGYTGGVEHKIHLLEIETF